MALNIERLEPRILLTASVKQSGANLVIKGDAASDTIEVEGTGTPGEMIVRVDLDGDEKFEGDGEVRAYQGVNNVVIRTNNGHDSVKVEGLQISGKLQIQTGAGNDVVSVNGSEIGRNVNIQAGNGDDEVALGLYDGVVIGGQLAVNLGSGSDVLLTNDIDVGGRITVNGAAGFDQIINLGGTSFLNNMQLKNIVPGQLPNDEPIATDDDFSTSEDQTVDGNLITGDNGHGVDSDPESDSLSVYSVNGQTSNVGTEFALGSGALLTVNSNGSYSYNPNGAFDSLAAGESDTDSFTYTVSDGHGNYDTATVTITINGVNNSPTAADDEFSVDQDGTVTGNLVSADNGNGKDTDPDASDTLVITEINGKSVTTGQEVTLLSGAILTINADGSFSYNTNGAFDSLPEGETETDVFTYTISDGQGGTATATVTVTINGLNGSPTAENDAISTNEDTIATGNLLSNDSDPDEDPLTVTKVNGEVTNVGTQITLDSGAKLTVNADGTYSYDPDGAFDSLPSGETGSDSFTYTISDGKGGTSTATVTVTITGVNDAPVAQNDSITTTEDAHVSGNLLSDNGNGADSDAEGDTLTVTKINSTSVTRDNQSITLASGAKLTISKDGTYKYDPNGKFNSLKVGETATDSFTYTISDGNGGTAAATVTVTITGLNDAPTAKNDSFSVDEGKTLSNRDVLSDNGNGADSDPDGDTLAITKFNGQDLVLNQQYNLTYGKITWSTSGGKTVFTYVANSISGGDKTESFTYTISDGNGGTSTATVSIKVKNK